MKAAEALRVLNQLPLDTEVDLVFKSKRGSYKEYPAGDDHPCGGLYETQAERFGQ